MAGLATPPALQITFQEAAYPPIGISCCRQRPRDFGNCPLAARAQATSFGRRCERDESRDESHASKWTGFSPFMVRKLSVMRLATRTGKMHAAYSALADCTDHEVPTLPNPPVEETVGPFMNQIARSPVVSVHRISL
jgi:hypothetical protein